MGFEDVLSEFEKQQSRTKAPPTPTPPTPPTPPDGLTGDALKEFNRLVPILGANVRNSDINLVAGYCVEICRYWECQKILKRDGLTLVTHSGYSQQRPEVTISRQSLQNAISLAAQIGLSAKARKQLHLQPPPTPWEELSDFEKKYGEI